MELDELRLKKRAIGPKGTAGGRKARRIPKIPPRLPTPPPPPVQKPRPSQTPAGQPPSTNTPSSDSLKPQPTSFGQPPATTLNHVQQKPQQQISQPTPTPNPFSQPKPTPNPFSQPPTQSNPPATFPAQQRPAQAPPTTIPAPTFPPQPTLNPVQPVSQASKTNGQKVESSASHLLPETNRLLEIHGNLKRLRKYINAGLEQDPPFKKQIGNLRRKLKPPLGQLTQNSKQNQREKIVNILLESLAIPNQFGLCDPAMFMLDPPEPQEGARYNGEMPSLFIYFVSHFAKAVVGQWAQEASTKPTAALPIGVAAVSIFARPDFLWRGKPLIDILLAKIRHECPVIFGLRGNEKTEEGRARLGWKREKGVWFDEQSHMDRMTGLGAGYASLCLRDFSKSTMKHPWPPTHYWQAIAVIVSTPPNETSSTQYTVLKALINENEGSFLKFYGSAARAALRVALVDFPSQAPKGNVAAASLQVLADQMAQNGGLRVR
ncbi:hypothetical protein G7Y89_g15601 [Cudoniella acicularis]|uniref:mRNA export factor GLE1 n=1 Tax=Cudoniella acicularis TaxID=354080 RepID=A0A8H4VK08_9HELO|nr:hypothetical protein G7Y89_g15601 [Cudoniella acicularis]